MSASATAVEVLGGSALWSVEQADCLDFLASLPPDSVDLVFGSPPYELARLYLENGTDLGIARDTDEWVSWMVDGYRACLRVCTGLVAFVVGHGQRRDYAWTGAPALLCADLLRAGITLRPPKIYRRIGIPGSGGQDDLRQDFEWILCATRGGKLPWADPTACGHPPKWAPGGEMSHRLANGARKSHTKRKANGTHEDQSYAPPALANPGTVIPQLYTAQEVAELLGETSDIVDCVVGGGQMGNTLASCNEAPFPESLAAFFVRTFCPPGGVVLDCFAGSGTTLAVALRHGRRAIGADLRASQVELTRRRVSGETPSLFAGAQQEGEQG